MYFKDIPRAANNCTKKCTKSDFRALYTSLAAAPVSAAGTVGEVAKGFLCVDVLVFGCLYSRCV